MAFIVPKLTVLLTACALAVALGREHEESHHKHAWVTMGFVMEGSTHARTQGLIYEIYALASSVRQHSKHPLVLITDLSTFNNSGVLKTTLESMGVHLHDMQHLQMPQKFLMQNHPTWGGAWNKLQMFNMTHWDRLVWLDTDGMLTRNMDHLFHKKGTWSQGDDWFCQGYPLGVCSGLVSFKPDEKVFKGILSFSETLNDLEGGDQELIEKYYKHIGKPIHTLPFHEAAFGQCANKTGDIPGFLHKPVGYTDCMRSLMLYGRSHEYAEYSFSRCTNHTMGRQWRKALCASDLPVDFSKTQFCGLAAS